MKLITCVIRPERLAAVKEALFRAGVTGITSQPRERPRGRARGRGAYRGTSLVLEFRDKVKIEMACSEPFVEPTIGAIVEAARTGDVGDGRSSCSRSIACAHSHWRDGQRRAHARDGDEVQRKAQQADAAG